jgi:outer membrane protein insertion porin family
MAAALSLFLCLGPAAAQQETRPPLKLAKITVNGLQRLKPDFVVAEAGLRVGDEIIDRDINRAVRRLFATGNFDDITPYVVDADSGRIELRFDVKERPYISDITFRGLQHIKSSTVLDTIDLKAGGPLRPSKIEEAKVMTARLLANKGYQLRSFSDRLEPVAGRNGDSRLIFDVEEGGRVALADIEFEGNTLFSDDDLRGALDTKKEGFFWFRPGTYDSNKVRDDLRENLPSYYNAKGHLDFVVVGDSIAVDPETGKAKLVITVEEGPQYKLASFEISGNRHFSEEELKRYFEQEAGSGFFGGFGVGARKTVGEDSIFDAVAFNSASNRIQQLYRNQGYLYMQVRPRVEKVEGQNAVRVAWDIQEGEPAYIRRVNITGNTFTHEDVIRGTLLTIPGDVYSEELLIQSYQRIGALGFFEMPMPTPGIQPDEATGDVDITFEVKEKQTGSVNFGTAVGGGTGLAGFLGYDQPNLFGQAKSGHLRWEFGRYSNNFEASYSDPSIKDSRFSGAVSLFSSRFRYYRFAEGQQRRTGASIRFGTLLPDNRSRLSVGYTLARTTYEKFDDEENSQIFSLPPGLQSTVTLSLQRQTLDHPLFPTSGTRQEFEANFNGGPLGGNGDFQKYILTGNWYVPVGQIGGSAAGARPIRFTLGLTAESGVLFGDANRFPFERFFMGGVQFGRPLRGYDETTVTPRGYFPKCNSTSAACLPLEDRLGDAYLKLGAEYSVRFNDNLSVGAFYDAGGVWREPSGFNPTRLLRGAGLGIMLVTPFGPIGLDYAYGFDKTNPGWQLHFKFGQGF